MKSCVERLWTNLNAMPGLIWVFGAWSLYRFLPWFVGILCSPSQLLNYGGWQVIGIYLLMLLGHLLTLWVVWSLIYRKSYALSFAMWYASLKIVAMFFALIAPLLRLPALALDGYMQSPMTGIALVFEIAAWGAFLYYLERSDAMTRLFPKESRRSLPWWAVIPMVALIGAMNL